MFNMKVVILFSKLISAGLATISIIGAGVRIGVIFGRLILRFLKKYTKFFNVFSLFTISGGKLTTLINTLIVGLSSNYTMAFGLSGIVGFGLYIYMSDKISEDIMVPDVELSVELQR